MTVGLPSSKCMYIVFFLATTRETKLNETIFEWLLSTIHKPYTPEKTNTTLEIHIISRKYIFIHGGCFIVMLVLGGVYPNTLGLEMLGTSGGWSSRETPILTHFGYDWKTRDNY